MDDSIKQVFQEADRFDAEHWVFPRSPSNLWYNWQKQTETERLMTLTPAQKKVWVYIASHIHKHKAPPTVREIAEYCGYSGTGGAVQILDRLLEKNVIQRKVKGKSRAYTLFIWPPPESFVEVE